MRILFFNHIENARQSLASTKLRTFLTMVGVTIGIASITAILSLASGAVKLIGDQVNQLEGNIAVIRSGAPTAKDNFSLSNTQTHYSTTTLTEDDLNSVRDVEHIAAAAPLMNLRTSLRSGDTVIDGSSHSVIATTPELAEISNLELRDGQFIDSVSNANTAVIGPQLSVDLFGTEQSAGKTFKVRDQVFTVIGILKRTDNPINFNNVDFDTAAIITLDAAKAFTQNVAQIQQINIKADSKENLNEVVVGAREAISENHQGAKDFSVLSSEEISRPTSELFNGIATAAAIIAGISLVVGGIGIMNIMLVNVAERTREIGIRKAVGATNRDIISQFIAESLAISIGGGLMGYVAGYIFAFAMSTFLPYIPAFSWEIFGVAMATSLVIGLVFGLYPAIRAAQKDPIESLRQYH